MARHRGVCTLRIALHGSAAREGKVLRRQAQQRTAVTARVCPERGQQVPVDRVVEGCVGGYLGQGRSIDAEPVAPAVGIPADRHERSPFEPERPASQRCEGVLVAPNRSPTKLRPGEAQAHRLLPYPRVEPLDPERRVEHHRTHAIPVPDRERLREVGPVGVPVDADHRHAELVEHGGEVICRRAGAVGVRRPAEPAGAAADLAQVRSLARLEPRAVDGSGAPRAAVVHDDHVVAPA